MTCVNIMAPGQTQNINDLAGDYYFRTGMVDAVHQQLVDDLFLFVNNNLNLTVAGMKRVLPGSHEISHTDATTSLLLVNEEKTMRIVPMSCSWYQDWW